MVPAPQQTLPLALPAQSGVPSQTQSVEFGIEQAVASGSQVEAWAALSGGSQQCWPLVQ
jgi:hypothetical protein